MLVLRYIGQFITVDVVFKWGHVGSPFKETVDVVFKWGHVGSPFKGTVDVVFK